MSCFACLQSRGLVNNGIHYAREKKSPRMFREFMPDEHDLASPATFFQRSCDSAVPRPDIVDSGKVRMSVEQALRLSIASLEVIEIFPQLHDQETSEVLSKNMPKSHLSLFMTAIAEAASKQRNLVAFAPDEPAEEMTREPTCAAVIDADVTDPGHIRNIGNHGQNRNSGCGQITDSLSNFRVIKCNESHTLRFVTKGLERLRKSGRIKTLDPMYAYSDGEWQI